MILGTGAPPMAGRPAMGGPIAANPNPRAMMQNQSMKAESVIRHQVPQPHPYKRPYGLVKDEPS